MDAPDAPALRAQLAEAARTAREAHRDTTRLVRLLTVIGRPGRPEALVDEVLRVLSDVYDADVVCLARTDDRQLVVTDSCGLPEDDVDLGRRVESPPEATSALSAGRAMSFPLDGPALAGARGELGRLPLRVVAWVPLLGPQPVEQMLMLARIAPVAFTGAELDVLHSVASRIRLSLSEGRRGVALERLARQRHRLTDHPDQGVMFAEAIDLLAELTAARTAWVVEHTAQGWTLAASRGLDHLPETDWKRLRLATLIDRVADGTPFTGAIDLAAVLAVPVVADDRTVAVLVAADEVPFHYPKATVEAVTILAGHLASGLVNAALYRSVQAGEASLRLITDSISDLVAVVDPGGTLTYASPSYERQLGLSPETLVGLPMAALVHVEDRAAVLDSLGDARNAPTVEYRLHTAGREWAWVETAVRRAASADGSVVLSTRLIDERRRLEDELRHQATHDTLTGLANRALVAKHLDQALARRGRKDVGLLFCDVDHFKSINDRLGHEAGDQLLRQVAERLATAVRPTDLLARFGGDEFVVVLSEVDGLAGVDRVGQRVIEQMKPPFVLLGEPVTVSFSVGGVAAARGDGTSSSSLLRDADAAMYAAKGAGRGRLEVFDEGAAARSLERLDLRRDLERGIDLDQLELHYQPIVRVDTSEPLAFEALVRWRHPSRGLVAPDAFVPLAEETGAVVAIGRAILELALGRLAAWHEEWADPALEMHVNVSPRQLDDPGFVDDTLAALRRFGLRPANLWLEITERGAVSAMVAEPLDRLRRAGVRVALDDFGVSSSNLELLRQLSPDGLKIDRSFVAGLTADRADQAIVRAVISMGEWMKLGVVAEGVETQQQLDVLRQMGCPAAQGYLFGRPSPASRITRPGRPAPPASVAG